MNRNHRPLQPQATAPSETTTTEPTIEPFAMEQLAYHYPFYYYRDIVTDVVYIRTSTGETLTAMLDPDTGLPLTYTRYLELYEEFQPEAPTEQTTQG